MLRFGSLLKGGLCRCTKVGDLLLTPLLVHRQSEPRAAVAHSRAEEGSRRETEAQDKQGDAKTRSIKEQRGEVDSPGKTLAGAASAAPARALPGQLAQRQQSEPPLSPRVPDAANNYIGPSARVVWPIVGQEIFNGDVGGGFEESK